MRKKSFGCRVYNVANDYNIEQTSVNKIINSYINRCRCDLLCGREVRFINLVSLIPEVMTTNEIKTTAFYAKEVAAETGFPYYTVLAVIKNYLKGLVQDVLGLRNVDIRRIVRIHIVKRETKYSVHSAISASMKGAMVGGNTVRVHTSKYLTSVLAEIERVAV